MVRRSSVPGRCYPCLTSRGSRRNASMTEPAHPFFASLAEQLNRGATRAALGLLSFRSDPLREHLRAVFQSAPGTGDSFLADPVFEPSFGWRLTENSFGGRSVR